MEPPARTESAMMLSGVNPTWGLMIVVAAQSDEVISALHTVDHLFPLKTAARCVSGGGELCCHKCVTQCQMAATAYSRGWDFAPCLIDSPSTPFFYVVKTRLRKVAAVQVAGEALVAWVV